MGGASKSGAGVEEYDIFRRRYKIKICKICRNICIIPVDFDTVLYLKKAADNGYYQSKGKNMIEVQMADEQFGFMQEKDTTGVSNKLCITCRLFDTPLF